MTTATSTKTVDDLEADLTEIDEQRVAAQQALREREQTLDARAERIRILIDETNMRSRPVYPTQAHIEGIAKVAELVESEAAFGDHHGTALDDQGYVRFSSRDQRINIMAMAPLRRAAPCGQLWEFTEEDLAAFRGLLKTNSLRATDMWVHKDGFGAVLVSTKV